MMGCGPRQTLKQGVCFYEARLYGKCFKVFRKIIEDFPASEEVNRAYYYIGLGHFKQGHYSRAIESLEKVGTAFSEKGKGQGKGRGGQALVRQDRGCRFGHPCQEDSVDILCKTKRGDEETLSCRAIGRNARIVLGSISTQLGSVKKGNGILEVGGGTAWASFMWTSIPRTRNLESSASSKSRWSGRGKGIDYGRFLPGYLEKEWFLGKSPICRSTIRIGASPPRLMPSRLQSRLDGTRRLRKLTRKSPTLVTSGPLNSLPKGKSLSILFRRMGTAPG